LLVAVLGSIVIPVVIYLRSKRRQAEYDDLRDENEKLKALLENIDVLLDPKNPPVKLEGLDELETTVQAKLDKATGLEASTLVKLGNVAVSTHRLGQAMRYYQAAQRVARSKGDERIGSVALGNAGLLSKVRVDYKIPLKHKRAFKPTLDKIDLTSKQRAIDKAERGTKHFDRPDHGNLP
jgi:hypothetical protein